MEVFIEPQTKTGSRVAALELQCLSKVKNPELSNVLFKVQNDLHLIRHKRAFNQVRFQETISKLTAIKNAGEAIRQLMIRDNEKDSFPQWETDDFNLEKAKYTYAYIKNDLGDILEYGYAVVEFISYLTALATVYYNCTHHKKHLEELSKCAKSQVDSWFMLDEKLSHYEKYVQLFNRIGELDMALENETSVASQVGDTIN